MELVKKLNSLILGFLVLLAPFTSAYSSWLFDVKNETNYKLEMELSRANAPTPEKNPIQPLQHLSYPKEETGGTATNAKITVSKDGKKYILYNAPPSDLITCKNVTVSTDDPSGISCK